uniref:Secreted protein n=1 Tax=Globodera pallida TaxID=36090 RepID=A0A183CHR1_GLOPA
MLNCSFHFLVMFMCRRDGVEGTWRQIRALLNEIGGGRCGSVRPFRAGRHACAQGTIKKCAQHGRDKLEKACHVDCWANTSSQHGGYKLRPLLDDSCGRPSVVH